MTIRASSPAFGDGDTIPRRYTCEGEDVSPPLSWQGVPADSVELVVLVEDPDAPGGTFGHWALWGVDPTSDGLAEGRVPPGASQGGNDFGSVGYRGPCPPRGRGAHRYVFTVFALSATLDIRPGASVDEVRRAMSGKVLDDGNVTGRYGR